jgi:RNA polymerase sigma-B factor
MSGVRKRYQPFAVDVDRVAAIDVIRVSGQFAVPVDAFDAAVCELTETARAIVVDLNRLTMMDAGGVRALVRARERCNSGDIWFGAAHAHGHPLEVLQVLGEAKDLCEYDTVDEAIREASRAVFGGCTERSIGATVEALLGTVHGLPAEHPHRLAVQGEAIIYALPLARSLAARYHDRGQPFDDLIQVASVGLVRAVRGFDPNRGRPFLAFAVPTILGELRRHFRDHSWAVRVPRHMQELRLDIARSTTELTQALGREPGADELADYLDISVAEFNKAVVASSAYRAASLDAPVSDDGQTTRADHIGAEDPGFDRIDDRLTLAGIVAALPERDRRILDLRFSCGLTQTEIAEKLGVSQMQVSRILSKIIGRLRREMVE